MLNQLLTIIGFISPLLLFAWLWQTKDWRIDRLREQFRETGILPNIFGKLRPLIIIICLPLLVLRPNWWPLVPLLTLAVLFTIYLAKKRQKFPKKTFKTLILLGLSIGINLLVIFSIPSNWLPLLTLLQPLVFYVAWLIFYPIDVVLKNKIRTAGATMRSQYSNLKVVGITGSVGKSSCKEILGHLLQDKDPLVTPKHINTDLGVSKWLQNVLPTIKKEEEKIVIVEMGAYRLGEIKTLCDIAQPQYSIITALGQQHIGLFGSQEKLIQAKSEIFTALPPDGIAFIEQEANFSKQALTFAKTNIITVGPHTNIFVSDVVETEVGQSGILNINSAKQAFTIPLHGSQVLPSVLLSVATAMQMGIKIERIIELLSSIPLPDQTFTIIKKGDITVLDDSYNASPSSFKAAINWAKKRPEELKILVTPGLIELGSASNSIHKELGELCRDVFAEVIFTGNGDKKAFEQGYGKTTLPRYSKNIDADLLVIEGKANINI